jgi:Tfp pilus assembly protein PilF
MRRKQLVRIAVVVACLATVLLGGCSSNPPDSKKEAAAQWGRTRAQVTSEVAEELLRVGKLDEAELKAGEALVQDPKSVPARLTLSKIYIEKGRYGLAAAHLARMAAEGNESADQSYLLGVSLEKDGKLAEALGSYYRAQALTTAGFEPIAAAAEVLVAMGRPEEARAAVARNMKGAKGDPKMLELAARLAVMAGEYAEGAEYYRQLCDVDEANCGYRAELLRTEYLAGQYGEASRTLAILKDVGRYDEMAWVHAVAGDCAMRLGRPQDARKSYQRAARLDPKSGRLWLKLARAELEMNAPEAAVMSARQALSTDRNNLDATMLLAYAELRAGQAARAMTIMDRAVGLHPGSVTAWCLLGRAQQAAGQKTQAMTSYRRAEMLEPGNLVVKELIASVRQKRIAEAN